jgi:hypothetical protein
MTECAKRNIQKAVISNFAQRGDSYFFKFILQISPNVEMTGLEKRNIQKAVISNAA